MYQKCGTGRYMAGDEHIQCCGRIHGRTFEPTAASILDDDCSLQPATESAGLRTESQKPQLGKSTREPDWKTRLDWKDPSRILDPTVLSGTQNGTQNGALHQ